MKDLKPAPVEATLFASVVLFLIGLGLAGYAASLFAGADTYAGFKMAGMSLLVWGSCFDPINCLWNFPPWGFGHVVSPSHNARFMVPMIFLGLFFYFWGWVGTRWLSASPQPSQPPHAEIVTAPY